MYSLELDEFGVVVSESGEVGLLPHGFAGGLWDRETGLVRYGARDYDPVTGRWTARDPILFGGGQSNLYAYVNNDPVNYTDPKGLIAGVDDAAILAGLGAAAAATALYGWCVAGGCEAVGNDLQQGWQGLQQGWQDLVTWSKARDSREGDGTRGLSYDEVREKFKDSLTKGQLEKLIQQLEKQRGDRNKRKRQKGTPSGGAPGGTWCDDHDE